MDDALARRCKEYVRRRFAEEDEMLRFVRQQTAAHGLPQISLEPNEARLLQVLTRLCGARHVVEVGTLAGYSGIWIGRALPAAGSLITIEKSSVHAGLARAHFARAGLAEKVTVLQGDGAEVLAKLRPKQPIDLIFIDADKASYPAYFAWAAEHLRVGGAVVADNVFWQGQIFNPQSADDHGLVEFNQALAEHPDFCSTIIEVGDGIALGVKTG